MQSVPPSPLKAEFTNTPPLGVKTLPVINAARELQFDHDQSDEKTMGHVTRLNQSQEFSKNVVKPEPFEIRPPRKISEGQMSASGQNTPRRSGSATMFEDSLRGIVNLLLEIQVDLDFKFSRLLLLITKILLNL
jgi:hypothetical protein